MTKLLISLSFLAASPAFAYDFPSDVGAPQVRYLSWCVQNQVMEEGSRGEAVLKADCSVQGAVCKQEERIVGGGWISYAFCQARR